MTVEGIQEHDPKFLKNNFKDLLVDQDKTLRLILLYSCNKVASECHLLPRHHGLAELEKKVGAFRVFTAYD